ncbi:MAG: STAS domain-containing protein, partial [Betaproteobacteria bacterium]
MAALAIRDTDVARVLALSGRLDANTISDVWRDARRALAEAAQRRVVVDAGEVDYCDGAGIALLIDLLRQRAKGEVELANLKPAFATLLGQYDLDVLDHDLDPEPRRRPAVEEIGAITAGMWHDLRGQVEFVGETTAALFYAIRHPSTVRWRDVWVICERVGVDALPIVALISWLLGVILAFQSAIPMKKFGAEIFVAD